ncbi:MAG: extracellular solute-binding protein [Planctomycetota bacterium]
MATADRGLGRAARVAPPDVRTSAAGGPSMPARPTLLSRRAFLRGACSLPLVGFAACQRDHRSGAAGLSLHEAIAAKVHGRSRRLTVFYPKGSFGNLKPAIDAFRRMTGVEVDGLEASLDEISAEMVLAHQTGGSGKRFDVAIPATFGIPDLVESGAIVGLDDLAAAHEPPGMMQQSIYSLGDRYLGSLYGYQADGDAYMMFYNRDWLEDPDENKRYEDAFGTSLRVPLTWRELDRQLQFFHRPKEQRYGGSLFRTAGYIGWEYWVRLHATGLWPLDDAMRPRFDRAESLRALEELVAVGPYLEPGAETNGLFANFRSFADGTKYANIGWGGTQKFLNGPESKLRGRLAFGPIPGGVVGGRETPMPYFNWGWNYVVSAGSPDPELAYLFILFASTPHVSTLSVREPSGYFDPFRVEHYDDPVIRDTYGGDFLDVHRASLAHCIPDLYLCGHGRYQASLKHAVHSVYSGYLDAPAALSHLQAKWEQITDQLGRDTQVEQWRMLKRSYPDSLRSLLT